ncbi:MAG: hypothetical protein PHN18_06365 [Sulfurospirillaceae bacterium]|nr:hypothetical protein [Sulfurospirillaceae bacterium]MDD2825938.1 hypothetical protein [Sulfurospirillaceae bacterium]
MKVENLASPISKMNIVENNYDTSEFKQYFYDNLDNISKIDVENSRLFQKILYITFLDSLAASFYPECKKNKQRFIQLIDKFSDWGDKDRICTTYLVKKLDLNSDIGNQEVREMLKDKVKKWERYGLHYIEIAEDLPFDSIIKHFDNKNTDFRLENFKHSHLLYSLRNVLVHRHQSKKELGVRHPELPFYERYSIINEIKKLEFKEFELIHPNIFLKNLCKKVLDNFLIDCQEKKLNPFSKYYAGDYLLDVLNKD